MPGVASFSGARIFEGLVLKTLLGEAFLSAVGQQTLLICGDEMGHRAAVPHVTMEPKTPSHRVNHSIATALELYSEKVSIEDVGICHCRL
jgi:hypothetical protein